MRIEGKSPSIPLFLRGKQPLFDKWFDETHHPELVEGEGLACLPVGRGRFNEKGKMMDHKRTSPEYVQTSLAASLTLDFQQGLFHRNAKLKGLNLLLHYEEGCLGRCHFCGLSRSRLEGPRGKAFIRVDWPLS